MRHWYAAWKYTTGYAPARERKLNAGCGTGIGSALKYWIRHWYASDSAPATNVKQCTQFTVMQIGTIILLIRFADRNNFTINPESANDLDTFKKRRITFAVEIVRYKYF